MRFNSLTKFCNFLSSLSSPVWSVQITVARNVGENPAVTMGVNARPETGRSRRGFALKTGVTVKKRNIDFFWGGGG